MSATNIAKHQFAKTMDAKTTLFKSREHYKTSNGRQSMKKVIAKQLLEKNSNPKLITGCVSENLKQAKRAITGCLREKFNSKHTLKPETQAHLNQRTR